MSGTQTAGGSHASKRNDILCGQDDQESVRSAQTGVVGSSVNLRTRLNPGAGTGTELLSPGDEDGGGGGGGDFIIKFSPD
ncbi:hypothetical protein ANN_18358 [Periplaneta americana]|uniref:Uncharacterized protein n=1 Tax=Periplaneta americana TaxID=6978 RepID=A0ABQ8SPS6_PERAM|nr:hypothetical protein ANN_18358 [Periplaneta americana]